MGRDSKSWREVVGETHRTGFILMASLYSAWRVVCTWLWRLNASSRSEPDLPTALSLHGATEQTMEEDGWLGRPTVRGSYSRQAVHGMPRAAEKESGLASVLIGAVYWYRLVARDIAFAELSVPLSTCAVGACGMLAAGFVFVAGQISQRCEALLRTLAWRY